MVARSLWMPALLALVIGCGGSKKAPEAAVAASDGRGESAEAEIPVASTGFVEIDMSFDDEEDDMMASELMSFSAECGDLMKLEPKAMMGKLSDAEVRCLDSRIGEVERMTMKNKISRVLMADAWARGNPDRWETVVRRHLTDIDRSDPDLCYKFALHLYKSGPSKADETMKWADTALENKSVWEGNVYISRVYNLYKIKTLASQKLWESLEVKHAKSPSDETLSSKDEARNKTKTLAREWLDYARASQKDITMAYQVCVSAAGTEEFCAESDS